jgi:D-tyrosyl-tRNA(Tyr) deacylase
MRTVVQRVKEARVEVADQIIGQIGEGILVFLGIGKEDRKKDADYLIEKVINLRIFENYEGKMNLSLKEIKGEMLVVSQFTLLGDCRKGRRPSFSKAARPEEAKKLYEYFISESRKQGITVSSGKFQAMMEVSLLNDGPVTLLIDSKKLF